MDFVQPTQVVHPRPLQPALGPRGPPPPPPSALDPRLAGEGASSAGNPISPPTPEHPSISEPSTGPTLTTTTTPPPPPADDDDSDSHHLGTPEPFESGELDELVEHLQGFARTHGFALVRSSLRRREDKTPTRLNLLCDRHGRLRNHRGLTDETRVRKRRQSRGLGCPYRIAVTLAAPAPGDDDNNKNAPPAYRFRVTNAAHNHAGAAPAAPHWKHRQLGPAEMRLVRRWYVDGKTPKDMLRELKAADPASLYGLKDVQNARAKARVQFLEFIEGGPVAKA